MFQVFNVEQEKRYRFRLISNAVLHCPLKFTIDNHNLTIIASDGRPFEPYEVHTHSYGRKTILKDYSDFILLH